LCACVCVCVCVCVYVFVYNAFIVQGSVYGVQGARSIVS